MVIGEMARTTKPGSYAESKGARRFGRLRSSRAPGMPMKALRGFCRAAPCARGTARRCPHLINLFDDEAAVMRQSAP